MNDNHSSDNNAGKSNKGFSGFDSMVTDNLDKTIADVFQGDIDKKPQEVPRNVPKQVPSQSATQPANNQNSQGQSTPPAFPTREKQDTSKATEHLEHAGSQPFNIQKTGTGGSSPPSNSKTWIWVICITIFVIYLISYITPDISKQQNQSEKIKYSVPSSPIAESSPVNPNQNISNPDLISKDGNQKSTIAQFTEEKPPIGTDRVLSRDQIRYCLSEKIRLTASEERIDSYVENEVGRHNKLIDDYNSRCGKFRYRSGVLENVRKEVETNRQLLDLEGRLRFAEINKPNATTEMTPVPQPVPKPVIKKPDSTILAIQKALNALQYNAGTADGFSGMNTTTAIKAFQRDQNLFVDGVASPLLLDQLEEVVSREMGKTKQAQSNSPPKSERNFPPNQELIKQQPAIASKSEIDLRNPSQVVRSKEEVENLKTCLDGNFPSICKHNMLTSDEKIKVDAAERRANLKTCLDGNFPSICKNNMLTSDEKIKVDAAERRANLKTCLDGNFPSICKHNLLTSDEKIKVDAAERGANLKTCLDGNFPSICKHNMLTSNEKIQVDAAERRAKR